MLELDLSGRESPCYSWFPQPLPCGLWPARLRLRDACALRTVFKPWLASLGHGHRYATGG